MKYKAVIFDMDGLLIDNYQAWRECSSRVFLNHGIALTDEEDSRLHGRSLAENMIWLKTTYDLKASLEELSKEYLEASSSIYPELSRLMPGADDLIKSLHAQGQKKAIASGSSLERIQKIVDRFKWRAYFDELVSTDQVNFVGKPDPAIYHYTAKVLSLAPDECVVLEDSLNGVKAAKSAGMTCVAVPGAQWNSTDFSVADVVVNSLEDKSLLEFIGVF